MNSTGLTRGAALLAIFLFLLAGTFHPAWGFGLEGIKRDTFPVFNDPKMLTVAAADKAGVILPRDAVVGIVRGRWLSISCPGAAP